MHRPAYRSSVPGNADGDAGVRSSRGKKSFQRLITALSYYRNRSITAMQYLDYSWDPRAGRSCPVGQWGLPCMQFLNIGCPTVHPPARLLPYSAFSSRGSFDYLVRSAPCRPAVSSSFPQPSERCRRSNYGARLGYTMAMHYVAHTSPPDCSHSPFHACSYLAACSSCSQ